MGGFSVPASLAGVKSPLLPDANARPRSFLAARFKQVIIASMRRRNFAVWINNARMSSPNVGKVSHVCLDDCTNMMNSRTRVYTCGAHCERRGHKARIYNTHSGKSTSCNATTEIQSEGMCCSCRWSITVPNHNSSCNITLQWIITLRY